MRRIIAAFAIALAFASPARADEAPPPPPGPSDVISYMYKLLGEKEGGCYTYSHNDAVLYNFTPALLLEYKKAMSVDFPVIDGDVFRDSQDGDPSAATVKQLAADAKTATVEASFTVSGEARKLVYVMMLNGTRWQIDDIDYQWRGDKSTLRSSITAGLSDAAMNGMQP